MSTGVIEDLQYSMEDMAQLDTFPTIGSGNLKKVVISQGTEKTKYSSENDDDAKSMATIAGGLGAVSYTHLVSVVFRVFLVLLAFP